MDQSGVGGSGSGSSRRRRDSQATADATLLRKRTGVRVHRDQTRDTTCVTSAVL